MKLSPVFLFSALIACVSFAVPTFAADAAQADYPKKPYRATYDYTGPTGKSVMIMSSDGKGHTRTESNFNNFRVVSIADYIKRESISLLEAQKMATRSRWKPGDSQGQITDEASARKHKAKSLGVKEIAGRKCKGWQYSVSGAESTVWVDESVGCVVSSVQKTPQGTISMLMKEFSPTPPPADAFSIPPGYKVMSAGG